MPSGSVLGLTAKLGLDTDDKQVENETKSLKSKISEAAEAEMTADTDTLKNDIVRSIEEASEDAKWVPDLDFGGQTVDDQMGAGRDNVSERLQAMGQNVPGQFGGPRAQGPAGGVQGMTQDALAGMRGAGGKFLKVALAGTVGLGILSSVTSLADSAPRMEKTMSMIQKSISLFARPFFDVIAKAFQPYAEGAMKTMANFNKYYAENGLMVAIGGLMNDVATERGTAGPGETAGRTVGGLTGMFAGAYLGAKGGAAAGGAIGSVVPGAGTLGGAIIGGGLGAIGGGLAGLGLGDAIGEQIDKVEWPDYISPLEWPNWLRNLSWATFMNPLHWPQFVGGLVWHAFVDRLGWADWLSPLTWPEYIADLNWNKWLSNLNWSSWLSMITWSSFVPGLRWGAWIGTLAWGTWVADLNWRSWVPDLRWESWVMSLNWQTWVNDLQWRSWIDSLQWRSWVDGLQWRTWVDNLHWRTWVDNLQWRTWVDNLQWRTWVDNLHWRTWVDKLQWGSWIDENQWSRWLNSNNWGTWIDTLGWYNWLDSLVWSSWLDELQWGTWLDLLFWFDWIEEELNWGTWVDGLNWGTWVDGLNWGRWLGGLTGGIGGLASGGVVTKPTSAVIGEGTESEAVLPLSELGAMLDQEREQGRVSARPAPSGGSGEGMEEVVEAIDELKKEIKRLDPETQVNLGRKTLSKEEQKGQNRYHNSRVVSR